MQSSSFNSLHHFLTQHHPVTVIYKIYTKRDKHNTERFEEDIKL